MVYFRTQYSWTEPAAAFGVEKNLFGREPLGNMGENPTWRHMWGAKVKMPCDMEDDVLEDVIKHVTEKLSAYDNEEWEQNGLQVSCCVFYRLMKKQTLNP